MPNPDCVPGSTYFSHLTETTILKEYGDIKNDRSLSVLYYFPKQLTPHRSALLPGARSPPRVLQANDLEITRSGGRARGRGGFHSDRIGRGALPDRNRNDPFHGRSNNYSSNGYPGGSSSGGYSNGRGGNGPGGPQGRGGYGGGRGGSSHPSSKSSYFSNYGGYGSGIESHGPAASYGRYGPASSRGAPPSHNYSMYGRNDNYGGYGAGYGGYGNFQGSFGGETNSQISSFGGYGSNQGYGNSGRGGGSHGQGRGGRGRGGDY